MTGKKLNDEIADLTEAVRELRDREVSDTLRDLRAEVERLRAERATHHCIGCKCMHIQWYPQTYPLPGCAPVPLQIWYGNTFSTTNAAAGCNPAVTTLSISNWEAS